MKSIFPWLIISKIIYSKQIFLSQKLFHSRMCHTPWIIAVAISNGITSFECEYLNNYVERAHLVLLISNALLFNYFKSKQCPLLLMITFLSTLIFLECMHYDRHFDVILLMEI